MRSVTLLNLCLAAGLALTCSNKSDAPKKVQKTDARKAPNPTETITLTAEELHKKYFGTSTPEELFAGKRVAITGTIAQVHARRDYTLVFTAGPARQQVSVAFRDRGRAAQAKRLQVGASVTAVCKVKGRLAMRVELEDCVLK